MPWGDYGDTLVHGFAVRDDATGLPHLSRTGPFVPPIFFAGWSLVVDDKFRTTVGNARFSGFDFRPVVNERIVKLNWHLWDKSSPDRLFYPDSGEPEDYLLEGLHSPEVSESIGPLWELYSHIHPGLQAAGGRVSRKHYSGEDFCRGSEPGRIFVSVRAREWLEEQVGEWVSFTPAIDA